MTQTPRSAEMDPTQPTQPLDKTDYIALYIHYEERGAEIRGQMISALTFLYAFLAPLVGFLVAWVFEPPDADNRQLTQLALMASWVGLALSAFSLYLVSDFRKHMDRNYAKAKAVLCTCDGLKEGVERIRATSLGIREKKTLEEARSWINPFLEVWFLRASWALTLFFAATLLLSVLRGVPIVISMAIFLVCHKMTWINLCPPMP
jgi:hypothetical protein